MLCLPSTYYCTDTPGHAWLQPTHLHKHGALCDAPCQLASIQHDAPQLAVRRSESERRRPSLGSVSNASGSGVSVRRRLSSRERNVKPTDATTNRRKISNTQASDETEGQYPPRTTQGRTVAGNPAHAKVHFFGGFQLFVPKSPAAMLTNRFVVQPSGPLWVTGRC